MIRKMGYSGYFLIVWDFIRYARRKVSPLDLVEIRGRIARSVVHAHHRRRPA